MHVLFSESFAGEEVKPLHKQEHECVCEGNSCATGNRCMGHQCFSSVTVNSGSLVYQKGCFNIYEQSTLTCKTPPSRDQIVECCHGPLCNMNSTVELPVRGTALHYPECNTEAFCMCNSFCTVLTKMPKSSIC